MKRDEEQSKEGETITSSGDTNVTPSPSSSQEASKVKVAWQEPEAKANDLGIEKGEEELLGSSLVQELDDDIKLTATAKQE